MEQIITPPPSFSVLRVRRRPRAKQTEGGEPKPAMKDDNRMVNPPPNPEECTSPVRGRPRVRTVRPSLTLGEPARSQPSLTLSLPLYSPPPTSTTASLTTYEEELLFQMSPLQPPSPTSVLFPAPHKQTRIHEAPVERPTNMLAALWENQKRVVSCNLPSKTSDKNSSFDTITQHRRRHSDSMPQKNKVKGNKHTHRPSDYGAKTLLDLTSLLSTPARSTSPVTPDEPFLYSFPKFDSSPFLKARQARERRVYERTKRHDASEDLTANGLKKPVKPPGPILARKLRIEDEELLFYDPRPEQQGIYEDDDDVNFISHAFRSTSLDNEKDLEDEEYYTSSQACSSSVSSSSMAENSNRGSVIPGSIIESFPVRVPYASADRRHSDRSPDGNRTERFGADEKIMMERGRPRQVRARASNIEIEYDKGRYRIKNPALTTWIS